MEPTNSYVDLTIIDCNRQHSVQAISGNDTNPALFTNDLGDGIELNVGDKVAVQGAYISEIGAGSDTIELKGQELNSQKTITYIDEENIYPTSLSQAGIPLINGFQSIESTEATHTFFPKDNETSITTEYYLSANGDSGYMFLPRRFAWSEPNAAETDPLKVKYWADNWLKNDSLDNGRPHYEQRDGQFCSDDFIYVDTSASTTSTTGFYRLKSDNSRYTLMRAVNEKFELRQEITTETGNFFLADISGPKTNTRIYKIFRNRIDLKVSSGFNSPSNISAEITRSLKNAQSPKVFQSVIDGITHDLSITYDTPTFKPFLCASSRTMSKDNWTNWNSAGNGSTPAQRQGNLDFKSNFYNVYCKRPELRETGQTFDSLHNYQLFTDILQADRLTDTVETTIPWELLEEMRDFIISQELYPELFSNRNAQVIQPPHLNVINSVDNMRFIHMNKSSSSALNLGNDETDIAASAVTEQSLPLFFYYQKENRDKYTEGTSENDLSYGFAKKRTAFGFSYITLVPSKIGGINTGLFHTGSLDADTKLGFDYHFNAYGMAYMLGFNGRLEVDFGNCNLWGIGDKNRLIQADQSVQPTTTPTAEHLRFNYVGANNPKFEYDPVESRFRFTRLHTPELTGQSDYGAGDTGTIADYAMPTDNTTNANAVVYKINKRINEYVYSPDMRPYDRSFTTKYPFPAPNKSGTGKAYPDPTATPKLTDRKISDMNRNMSPWAIFDSPTGIFINDLGYTEEQFPNGLWGLLGFTWESVQSPATPLNNRLKRIDNSNKGSLNLLTTNADIVGSDTRDYIVNQFGAVYFTTQIPTPSCVGPDPDYAHVLTNSRHQYTAPISQGTVSINLVAPNLPRKMLKPYYCIRSDIIDRPHYLGGIDNLGVPSKLPVVSICDKQYSGNDFIFSSESDYVFTITKKKTITSITTSIHDPNQSFSKVNNDSSVIYKISRNITNRLDIAAQVMAELSKENSINNKKN
jgi:hypothetical protein